MEVKLIIPIADGAFMWWSLGFAALLWHGGEAFEGVLALLMGPSGDDLRLFAP